MKKKTIMNYKTKINVVLLITLIVTSIFLAGCEYSFSFNNTNQLKAEDAKEFKVEKTSVEPIQQININAKLGDIEFIEDDNYYVEIDYRYFEEEPDYKWEGGTLTFDDFKSFPNSYSISFSIKNTVKIYLPKDAYLERIKIAAASGDVALSNFLADKLNVSVAYGDFDMKKSSAAEANISMASGNSDIRDFNVEKLDFSNSYGDAEFTNINTGATVTGSKYSNCGIKVSMASGNCVFDSLTGKTLDISNSYGSIKCKGLFIKEFDSDLSSGNLTVSGSAVDDLDISNSYGDVTLELKGDSKEYMLDLNTSYGSIDIDGKHYDSHLTRENNGHKNISADLSSGDIGLKFE
ncbi:MAG: DUF4097 family beta strand repeat-containing protein [Anaerocolumna sp.]